MPTGDPTWTCPFCNKTYNSNSQYSCTCDEWNLVKNNKSIKNEYPYLNKFINEPVSFENYIPPTWDELFMGKVYEIARKSKDPRTKIGAVLVKNGHAPLEGFNGIPKGVDDLSGRMGRPEKYHWMEHAERNVINMAAKFGISTEGGILYTQGMPCVDCSRGIVNCGIKEVVLHEQWENVSTKLSTVDRPWAEHYWRSGKMFNEAGIKVRFLNAVLGKIGYLDGKKFNV